MMLDPWGNPMNKYGHIPEFFRFMANVIYGKEITDLTEEEKATLSEKWKKVANDLPNE